MRILWIIVTKFKEIEELDGVCGKVFSVVELGNGREE